MFITSNEELAAAVQRMRLAGTDLMEYELKSAAGGFPQSTADTISAFANTVGGSLVFGIAEKGGFHAVRDLDVKLVQSGCAHAARELVEPAVAASILVLEFESRPVVVANIPEARARQKPCYVRKLGQMNGSFIRTGDGDHKMSLYEIDRFIENQNRSARNDATIVRDATIDDLDESLLSGWLSRVRQTTLDRSGESDEELMANRRVVAVDEGKILRPTLAGLMALGRYPQKFFPRLNVVFTCYPTPRKGEIGSGGSRFADALNIDGPIPAMVVNAVRAVSRNMKHGAIVKGALRENIPDYPLPVIREAVANALMHRDYSLDGQGTPVLVDLYPDRLEISNPGGLFGTLTVDQLGHRGGTSSRNQFLARILEDVPYTDYDGREGRVVENRGSGYPTITQELEKALMAKPIIRSSLANFDFMIRHRKMTDAEGKGYSKRNVEDAILAYLSERESVSTSEVARAAGISSKTARGYINRLVSEGILDAIGTKNSPKRRYRINR